MTTEEKIIKTRVGLLELARQLGYFRMARRSMSEGSTIR